MKIGIYHPTEETKRKAVETRMRNGSYISANKGKHLSEETKQKISIATKISMSKEEVKKKLMLPKTEEHKKRLSEVRNTPEVQKKIRGINSGKWLGGKSLEKYGIDFTTQLKNKIRNRDNQICMNCGIHREKMKEALSIHHINYEKTLNFNENLISLCRSCHGLTGINREYWIKLFQSILSKRYGYIYSDDNKIKIYIGGING